MPKKLKQDFERLLPSLKDLYTAVFPKKKVSKQTEPRQSSKFLNSISISNKHPF